MGPTTSGPTPATGVATGTAGIGELYRGRRHGYATIQIAIPDIETNVTLKISNTANNGTEYFYIDDVELTASGSEPSYIPGYSNRLVGAGTSASVTD